VSLKTLAIAIVLGILVSFALGFVENRYGYGIPESKHYGYPLVWRSVQFLQQPQITEYNFTNFILDAAFWIVICMVAVLIFGKIKPSTSPNPIAS
jgi:hypothetical protein